MNMIVNTSDLVGYEAETIAKAKSARSDALKKAIAIWEKNQFKSAKRIGGLGMLAITLAACNSDDGDDDAAAANLATQLAAAQAAQAAAETAQAAAEAALAEINAAETTAAATPTATSMTAGVDNITGSSGDDVLSSGLDGTTQAMQSLDSVDLGAGDDTLTMILSSAVTPTISNVESLVVSGTNAAGDLDLSASTGYTSVSNTGSSAVIDISNIASGTALSLSNNTVGATFTLKAADFTGSADTLAITLNNVTAGNTTISAGAETLSITSSGSVSNVLNTVTTAPTTVNLSGSTALTYAEGLTTTTTVDASGMTGTLTSTWAPAAAMTYTGSTAADTLTLNSAAAIVETVNLGAGNDRVTFAQNLASTDVLDGGDGTDTIASTSVLIAGLDTVTATNANRSNFETVLTTDALDRAIVMATDVQATGITSFTTPGTNANDNAAVTMAAGDMTVNMSATMLGAFAATDTGTAITDSLTMNNTALTAVNVGGAGTENLTITGYETLNIVSNSVGGATTQTYGTIAITGDTGATTSLVITGNSAISTAGAITANTIDASGMTGEGVGTATFTMGGVGTGSTTITGSPGRDTLLAADTATTLNGGAGNDILTGGTAGDTINGGDGVDTIDAGAGAATTTADTVDGGAGNDSITMGQGIHNVNGGAGDDTVNMVATLSTGDVINGGDGTDTIRLNAAPTAATAGNVSNFERVQLDLDTATVNMATFGLNPGFTTITQAANTTTFSNLTSSVTQLELSEEDNTSTTVTVTRLVDGATDTLDIEPTLNSTLTTVSIVHEETVTIDAADGTLAITNFTTTDMTSLTATGDNAVNIGTSSGVNLATVDASAMTANFTGIASASIVAMTVSGPAANVLNFQSGAGADTVTSGTGNDIITTNNGNDTVTSGAGDDTIDTGGGNDTIDAGAGANGITGGAGADNMTGGAGVDTYVQGYATGPAPTATSIAAGAAGAIAIGDNITFGNGVDIITNFGTTTDDIVNMNNTGLPTTLLGKTENNFGGGDDSYMASGAWDSVNKTFTITTLGVGADLLVIDGENSGVSESIATTTGAFILIGVDSDNLVLGQFT